MRIVGWRLRSWSFEKISVAPDGVLKILCIIVMYFTKGSPFM